MEKHKTKNTKTKNTITDEKLHFDTCASFGLCALKSVLYLN